jgi:acetone carboxylase gamma subunit
VYVVDHKVWFGDSADNAERAVWECSCGYAGSAPYYLVEVAAEKHVRDGESMVTTNRRP